MQTGWTSVGLPPPQKKRNKTNDNNIKTKGKINHEAQLFKARLS